MNHYPDNITFSDIIDPSNYRINSEPDRFFDPHRYSRTDKANKVIHAVITDLDGYQRRLNPKKRKRRPADQATFLATISALVCDLMHHQLLYDERNLVIPRSKDVLAKRDRYSHPALNQQLPKWLDELSSDKLRWITQAKGHGRRFGHNQRTIIAPTERFVALMDEHGVELRDIGRIKSQETIILKAPKEGNKSAKIISYDDTAQTILWREQMTLINEWLAQADIEFDQRVTAEFKEVDHQDRFLRRSFTNGSFKSGGRLGGGFWMPLSKEERLKGIKINGGRVVSLDYGQCAQRILYGMAGVSPPSTDIYAIPGIDQSYRDGVKKLMSALQFSDRIPTKKPKGSTQMLPKRQTVGELASLIIRAHPAIAHYLPSQIGHEVQFIESEIIITVVMSVMKLGIVALPIHDCVLVPEIHKDIAKTVMMKVFTGKAGTGSNVSVETL